MDKSLESQQVMWVVARVLLAAAAIFFMSLALLSLGVGAMSVHAGNGLLRSMNERVDEIRVFLKDSVTVEERASMENFVRNMSEVKSVSYISKEQALEDFKKMYKDEKDLLQKIEGNPLPAELIIRMKDPKYNSVVAQRISTRPEISVDEAGKQEIKNPRETVDNILGINGAIQKRGLVIFLVLGLVALAIVSAMTATAINSRHVKIGIKKAHGATNLSIGWPFLIEGAGVGFFGGIVGIIGILLINAMFITKLEAASENVKLVAGGYLLLLSFMLIIIGIGIGALGSALGMFAIAHRGLEEENAS